jgi:hypothetical protein
VNLKEADALLNNFKFRPEDYYLQKYLVHYVASNLNVEMSNFSSREVFQNQINEINNYYLANVLRLYSMLAMFKHTLDLEFDLWLIEGIDSFISKNEAKIENDIMFFFCTLKMFTSGSLRHYFKSKELFPKIKETLKPTDLKFALYLLTNFCMMMKNQGDKNFNKEEFEILKLDAEISKQQVERLDSNHFINTVYTAAGAKEFSWAEKYIEELKHKLMPERSEDTYKYAKATLLYSQSKFNESLKFLSTISPTFWQSKSHIKDLTIKSYFELGMYEDIYYQIDSYRHYVKNTKQIPKYMRARNEEFIKYLQKLIALKNKPDKAEIGIFKTKMEMSNPSNKEWILSKLEEMSQ